MSSRTPAVARMPMSLLFGVVMILFGYAPDG
jgi:hypothetical protein